MTKDFYKGLQICYILVRKHKGGLIMQFVRTEELRPGMRLAKPIYNKTGVLLYERNSKLTIPAINSVRNFSLIGVYILEPAEPIPPLSREDLEFEQAQTVYMFKMRDIFENIYRREPIAKLVDLIEDVCKRYGSLNHRVNFNQNLRSADDFMYKHAISTAILTAMIAQHIEISEDDYRALITAAFLYGFGYRFVPRNILSKEESLTEDERTVIQNALEKGLMYLQAANESLTYFHTAISIAQCHILSAKPEKNSCSYPDNVLLLSEILKVAEQFDLMTGMMMGHKPESEIIAMNYLHEHTTEYNETIVSILAQCIHIIPAGASVDLSTKDKAIVLIENPKNYMEPVILRLKDNQIYDLSDPEVSRRIHIIDLMKTMDNRVEINEDTLKMFHADERIKEMTEKFRKKNK